MSAYCDSCGRPIEWAVTAKSRTRIPLDPEPWRGVGSVLSRSGVSGSSAPDRDARTMAGGPTSDGAAGQYGNLEVVGYAGTCPVVRVVPVAERAGRRLRLSHFATCPDAEEWRRKCTPPKRGVG